MLHEPGSSSLDLNLPSPSTEERRCAAHGSRTQRSPDSCPAQRYLFYQMLMNLCTETSNFHHHAWLCPQPLLPPGLSAALGGSWVPRGHHHGWGREAKQTRSRSASPLHVHTQEQASWPQGRYCLCQAGERQPGPGLRHALVSSIHCVGARRMGKAAGACCRMRSCTLLPGLCDGLCDPPCSSLLPALHLALGWVATALLLPPSFGFSFGVSIAPLLLVSKCQPAAASAQERLGILS